MKKEVKKDLDIFFQELTNSGFPYSYEVLNRDPVKGFIHDGLAGYDSMPNIEEIILLKSKEHPETDSDIKFLLVEQYKEVINDLKFGVPSFSYIVDYIGHSNVSCYQLDDTNVELFSNITEAVSYAIQQFETQNFQKDMTLDIFEDISPESTEKDKLKDLCLAESLILKFNENNRNLFSTELDAKHLKLMAYCNKYNNWTEITHIDNISLASQVSLFLSENYPLYVKESSDLASYYSMQDNKKVLKNKPI